jgi:hypothetical protein
MKQLKPGTEKSMTQKFPLSNSKELKKFFSIYG